MNLIATAPDITQAAREYLDLMLAKPKSTMELGLGAGLLVLVMAMVFPKIESAFDARHATGGKGWVMAVLAPVLLILTAAVLKVYALPPITSSTLQLVVVIAGVVLTFLLLVVPISKFLFNSEYVSSLMACGITFFCGAVAVLVVHLGFQAFNIGESAGGTINKRNEEIKEQ